MASQGRNPVCRDPVQRVKRRCISGVGVTIRVVHNSASQLVVQQEIDARGLVCPEPLMLVRNRIRSMASGDVLFVVATDPSTERDFANLCRFMGHTLLAADREGSTYRYWIRKGSKSSD